MKDHQKKSEMKTPKVALIFYVFPKATEISFKEKMIQEDILKIKK